MYDFNLQHGIQIEKNKEDEEEYWRHRRKGTKAKYSFWLMLLVGLPMLTSLIPVYDFVAAKVDEHDMMHHMGVTLGVVESYDQQVCHLYATYVPRKLKKEGAAQRFESLMHEWRGNEKRLIMKLNKQYAKKKKKEMSRENIALCLLWHDQYTATVQKMRQNNAKTKNKTRTKDDVFYQYQQRKQRKQALAKEKKSKTKTKEIKQESET